MARLPDDMTFEDLEAACEFHSVRALASPYTSASLPAGIWNHSNFPMTDMDGVDSNPSVHFIDLVTNYHLDISLGELEVKYKHAIVNKDMQLLPPPFGLRQKPPADCKLQIVLREEEDGTSTIFKHVIFPQKCKISSMKLLAFGRAHKPNYMQKPMVGRKILQYCLQNMGGKQFRCFDLSADVSVSKKSKVFDELEDDDLDKGFDFLTQNAPRSASDLQQLRWQTKQLRSPTSPICGWPQALVQQALRLLSSEGALARKEYHWPLPLTEKFYHTWLLEILEAVWDFDLSSLVMLGEPAAGKSPLGRSVLMAQCRHNRKRFNQEGEPCVRRTPEIDFLRGEPGTVVMGDFLDDPCTQSVGMKALKSLLDVGLYESMSWARWGAVKWIQNQPRALAANAYDSEIAEGESFMPQIKFQSFWDMVRPSFCKEASNADVDAILKRSVFIVNTKRFVYYRKAGVNDHDVLRKSIENATFLTEEGRKWYGKFKDNVKELPADFDLQVEKEQTWLSCIFKKLQEKRQPDHATRAQIRRAFEPDPPQQSALSQAESIHSARVAIKKEQVEAEKNRVFKKAKIWSCELRASNTVIDLEEDTEKAEEGQTEQTIDRAMEEFMDSELQDADAAADIFGHDGTIG